MGLARRGGGLTAAMVLLASCGVGGANGVASTVPSAATSTAPTTVPATTTAVRATTSTTEALVPQPSPDLAAKALLGAWSHGDRVGALHVATPGAVATLFAQPVRALSDRGCQDPLADRAACAFGLGGGLVQLGTVRLAGGWVVESAVVNP